MKSNNDAASVKCCARKIWAHFKEFVVSVKGDLKETHDEMFQGADTPKQRLQRSVKHGLLLLAQLCLIMGVYAAGCALASVLPITLPGNILGMVLLLVLLGTHILKTKYISEACDYLIDNMSVFFIPAGVAIMGCFSMLQAAAAKFAFVCIATTVHRVPGHILHGAVRVLDHGESWARTPRWPPPLKRRTRRKAHGRQRWLQQHAWRRHRQAPSAYTRERHRLGPAAGKEA